MEEEEEDDDEATDRRAGERLEALLRPLSDDAMKRARQLAEARCKFDVCILQSQFLFVARVLLFRRSFTLSCGVSSH